ncbi:MAG: 50S ribosomal protein L30 [Acidobacteria bacterium]|nr:MAG: 50S ribosomal protein L30 [Acidobacteriota bacterium]
MHIKWIRSGIGFTRKQKEIVRSIGLHRLNQVVERPDTVHFRGLVAKVCHLVGVVDPPPVAAWTQVPEYKILPAEPKAAVPSPKKAARKASAEVAAAVVEEAKAAAPEKEAGVAKSRVAKPSVKGAAKATEKPKPKQKTAASKSAPKKESKLKKGKK